MARTTRRPTARPKRASSRWLLIGTVVLAAAAGIAFFTTRTKQPTTLEALPNTPGVVHIHGLGVNPADGDLYAATHMGLFRITQDGTATRIANRYQDTMGFTIVGPDHFIASGHPDLREELPPLLGFIESKDAGKTWDKRSLLGKSDLHTLRFAHDTIYAYDSSGSAFIVSNDGTTWDRRGAATLREFVVSPSDPDALLSTTPTGLKRSDDRGRTWTTVPGPAQPLLLDWDEADRLWLVDFDGRTYISADAGQTWDARGGIDGRPDAFDAAGDSLYAAAGDVIYRSRDEGRTWQEFYRGGSG